MSIEARPAARRALTLVPIFALLAVAACASEGADEAEPDAAASDSAAPADPAVAQERMALIGELQSIDRTLQPIRNAALQDPELQAQQGRLVEQVQAAMAEIDPGVEADMARFDSLRAEFGAAQQAGEQERVEALATELRMLQASLQQTQGEALEQEEVAAALETFRSDLEDRMRAADPRADSLIERAEQLRQQLEAMQTPGG